MKVSVFKLELNSLCPAQHHSWNRWRFFIKPQSFCEEGLNNPTVSANQTHFVLRTSNESEGDDVNVKADIEAFSVIKRAQLLGFFAPSNFLINQAFTFFQLSDSVLHP